MTRAVLVFSAILSLAPSLHAATLTVTNTGDLGTASTCIAPVACSLRQAINRANSDAASDNIEFAIPGAGPHLISPTSALPIITQPANINGYSQAGSVQNTSTTGFNAVLKIQLSGANVSQGTNGLRLQENVGSIISGLSITNFVPITTAGGVAILGDSVGQLTVIGCAIGVTPSFAAAGNGSGIITSSGQTGAVRIGTLSASSPRAVNLISQNVQNAIVLNAVTGMQTGTSFIGRNLINVNADGSTFSNSLTSLSDSRGGTIITGNTIGGSMSLASAGLAVTGNVIQAFNAVPIRINGSAAGTGVIGGVGALANTIIATGGPINTTNAIVHEANGLNFDLSLNRIFTTGTVGQLGIDLGVGGFNANDPGDLDTGPNGLQNFPILSTATRTSATGVVSISGTLNSLANRSFRLVFYANPNAVRAGQFLGDSTTDVTTDANGNATFGPLQMNFDNGATVVNNVSATATLIDSVSLLPLATSEFAAPIAIQLVIPPATFTVTSVDDPGNGVCDSTCTLREAIVAANATGSATAIDEIRFNIPGAGPHTIFLGTALPALTQSVTIDGYSQPGASVNTDATGVGTNAVLKIEIRPVPAATFSLFASDNTAANVTVRGLSILAFNSSALRTFRGAQNRMEGCWIGIKPDGTEVFTSLALGFTTGSTFGGSSVSQRNIWMSTRALSIDGGQVRNSLFGVLASGRQSASVSTFANGLTAQGTTISGNVFSAPNGAAIAANNGSNELFDNAIGESFDAVTGLGLSQGLIVTGSTATVSSATHRIRGAQGAAITVQGDGIYSIDQAILGGSGVGIGVGVGVGNTSIRSPISGTVGLGIDLNNDGLTLNDLGDADTGPNGLQNFPVLTSAVRNGTTISVTGTLNSNASQRFRILICGIASQHSSLHGGCDEVLSDDTIVNTDASGNTGFSVTVPNNPGHSFVTATASQQITAFIGPIPVDLGEQTSEFALNIPITGFQEIILANGFEGN